MSSSKSNKLLIVATIAISIAVILILIILFLNKFMGSSSYKSTDESNSSVDVLSCTTNSKIESFFNTNLADEVNHKITVVFGDEHPADISYNLSAVYYNKDSFDREGRIWVTDYGLYMNENNLADDSIKNTLSSTDNKAWANFYTSFSNINAVTAKIFLLSEDNYLAMRDYDMSRLKQYYEDLGFNCDNINNKEEVNEN